MEKYSPPITMKPVNQSRKARVTPTGVKRSGALEALGGAPELAEQVVGALGEGERGQGLGGDDGDVGGVPEGRADDGPGAEGVGGEGGVHAEDVADELVVGVVIDHVVVGDYEGEGGEGGGEEEFAEAEGHGGRILWVGYHELGDAKLAQERGQIVAAIA